MFIPYPRKHRLRPQPSKAGELIEYDGDVGFGAAIRCWELFGQRYITETGGGRDD